MIYTGAIKDAYLLKITDLPGDVTFIYGTIVYDRTERFKKNDWIATSNLLELRKVSNGYAAITQNTFYFIESVIDELDIPWDAVTNIRMGTHPKLALKLIDSVHLRTKKPV
jgi:hypothetical protein